MSEELKPCPFCGQSPRTFEPYGLIHCGNEKCPASSNMVSAETWNSRPPTPITASVEEIAREAADGVWRATHAENFASPELRKSQCVDDIRNAITAAVAPLQTALDIANRSADDQMFQKREAQAELDRYQKLCALQNTEHNELTAELGQAKERANHNADIADSIARASKQVEDRLNARLTTAEVDTKRLFPMQCGPAIPWKLAELLYVGYSAQYGTQQSLERLAERGGFGWAEIEFMWKKYKRFREAIDKAKGAQA